MTFIDFSSFRKGLLTMYQCHHGGKLDELEVVEVVGVFDAKWCATASSLILMSFLDRVI